MTILLALLLSRSSFAVTPPCPEALGRPPTPFADFTDRLDQLRAAGAAGRRTLSNFVYRSEFLSGLAGSAQEQLTRDLLDPKKAAVPARTVLERVMRAYARRNAPGSLGAPLFRSLAELERHFSPARVVELRLIPDLVEEVLRGLKTSTIRAGNAWDIKSGPALFHVAETGLVVPIVIESVNFRQRLGRITPEDLRRQGPFVANLLDREGRFAATQVIGEAMKTYYPGFDPGNDVTVVRFRLRPN